MRLGNRKLLVGVAYLILLVVFLQTLGARAQPVAPSTPGPDPVGVSSVLETAPPSPVFSSPLFIALAWPLAFVVLEVTLSTLASTSSLKADGEHKYRVWFLDDNNRRIEVSPVDVGWIKKNIGTHSVVDIDVLAPNTLEAFSFGLDLCIGALSTDLAIVFAILSAGQTGALLAWMTTTVSILVLHFITASMTVYILRSWSNHGNARTRVIAVQTANAFGLLAIFSSFLVLGSLIVA